MADLAEWLLAQYDDDEQVAQAAIAGPWAVAENGEVYAPGFDREVRTGLSYPSRPATFDIEYLYVTCDGEGLSPSVQPNEAAHIARSNPAAVLADIAAKRRIVEWYRGSTRADHELIRGELDCMEYVVRLLAYALRGRDGYDPAWAPADD